MTPIQQILTLVVAGIATFLTRLLPFILFNKKKTPKFISYLGEVLPAAVFGLLVVYCLKDVSLLAYSFGLPEAIAIVITILVHLSKKNTLLSIATGTISYMLLVQLIFK